jgi:hypothetical protein
MAANSQQSSVWVQHQIAAEASPLRSDFKSAIVANASITE